VIFENKDVLEELAK